METEKLNFYTKALNLVPKILRLMDTFTFWKIVIAFFTGLFILCMIGLWDNRTLIVNQLISSSSKLQAWEVSDKTKTSIKEEVDRHPNVAWIVVTEMDLGANLKKFKFWYDEDQEVLQKNMYKLEQGPNHQIFDFDKQHTSQMVSVLQNEFVCNKFEETSFENYAPQLKTQTDYICRIAIPPFYGRFVGVLTIGVKGPITDDVRFSVKSIAANIAATIYWRDVIKLPR